MVNANCGFCRLTYQNDSNCQYWACLKSQMNFWGSYGSCNVENCPIKK